MNFFFSMSSMFLHRDKEQLTMLTRIDVNNLGNDTAQLCSLLLKRVLCFLLFKRVLCFLLLKRVLCSLLLKRVLCFLLFLQFFPHYETVGGLWGILTEDDFDSSATIQKVCFPFSVNTSSQKRKKGKYSPLIPQLVLTFSFMNIPWVAITVKNKFCI